MNDSAPFSQQLLETANRLAALAEPTRLNLFKRLVQRGPEGLCVSELVDGTGLTQPTMSHHLKELSNAGLLNRRKEGRRVFYAPDYQVMNSLMGYLMQNCCEGESCLKTLTACCEPAADAVSNTDNRICA